MGFEAAALALHVFKSAGVPPVLHATWRSRPNCLLSIIRSASSALRPGSSRAEKRQGAGTKIPAS